MTIAPKKRYGVTQVKAANASRQSAYRARHLGAESDGTTSRLNLFVSTTTVATLARLSAHYGVTKRGMLERLSREAEASVLGTMNGPEQSIYYAVTRLPPAKP